ncbi:MAG TPA: transporter [Bryobacteraceae bacterium]|nr:transporter [Bryobacteraceae bacterium]
MINRFAICLLAVWLPLYAHDPVPVGSGASNTSSKLIYLIPNLYGPAGLTLPNTEHAAHFTSAFQSSFGPLVGSIVNQLTAIPLPSPASGFLYKFDSSLGVYTRSGQSFGPIFAERAETIGKNKFLAGMSYQHFNFDHLDGIDIKRIPAVFQHQPAANPDYQKDVITTNNNLDLQVSQTVAYFTYGVSERLDVSVAVPMATASMEIVSDATIRRIGTSTDPDVHYFDTPFPGKDRESFAASGTARGIGDVLLRAKYTAYRWKQGAIAVGTDARMPTGDAYNFLGTGSFGLRPFVVASMRKGNFSPHINLAYQWNGDSILAGDPVAGTRGNQSDQFQYALGFDYGITPKFTFAADYLGQQQLQGSRVKQVNYVAANGDIYPNIQVNRARYGQNAAAVGVKVNPIGELLVTFNLLFGLDDNGLRDRVAPMIGLSYTF